jgi:hypothetical protein
MGHQALRGGPPLKIKIDGSSGFAWRPHRKGGDEAHLYELKSMGHPAMLGGPPVLGARKWKSLRFGYAVQGEKLKAKGGRYRGLDFGLKWMC